jgi:hypothetical protein
MLSEGMVAWSCSPFRRMLPEVSAGTAAWGYSPFRLALLV